MAQAARQTPGRRIQLQVSDELYDRLAAQALRGQASVEELVARWVEEKVAEGETREAEKPVDPEWRRRMEGLVTEFRSGSGEVSEEELEAEIAAARAEVRGARRAACR
jgi:hypothetical protein